MTAILRTLLCIPKNFFLWMVEAARAGEAGKGFAIVAQEIRQLADSCAETANHIQEVSGGRGAQSGREVRRGGSEYQQPD